jgi:hypothetical protein
MDRVITASRSNARAISAFRLFGSFTLGRTIFLSRCFVIGLAVWAFAVISPDFARVFDDYGTLGFYANNDGVITSVVRLPATDPTYALHDDYGTLGFYVNNDGVITSVDRLPAADSTTAVREHDCIDLKKTALADRLAVFGGMGGLTYVRRDLVADLWIARAPCAQAASPLTFVRLPAQPQPISRANRVLLLVDEILGIFFIGLAAFLVWRSPSPMTWGFFLYALWYNPGQTFVFYAELQRWPVVFVVQQCLQAIAQAVGYAGFILFALRFPDNKADPKYNAVERWILPATTGLFLVLSLLSFGASFSMSSLFSGGRSFGTPSEQWGRSSYGLGYLVDIGVLLILRARRKDQPPEDEQRTRWVHWGCRIGLAAFIFADSNMTTTWWNPVWGPLCAQENALAEAICDSGRLSETVLLSVFLLTALLPITVFHAVRRHRVVNVSFAISRATVLLLVWLILAWLIISLTNAIEHYLHSMSFLWPVMAILIVKLAFKKLHELLLELCDHVFFRRLHRAERRIAKVRTELNHVESLEGIDLSLTEEPANCLNLASAAVFRRDNTGAYRRRTHVVGWPTAGDGVGITAETVQRAFRGEESPLILSELRLDSEAPSGVGQPVLATPLLGVTGVVGVALYGAHRTGDDLTKEESALLCDLSAAASNAYVRVEGLELRGQIEQLRAQVKLYQHIHTESPQREREIGFGDDALDAR